VLGGVAGGVVGCVGGVYGGEEGGGGGGVVWCVGDVDSVVVGSDDVTDGDTEAECDGEGLTTGLVVRGAAEDGAGCACRVTGAAGDGTTTGNAAGEDTSGAWLPWTAVPRDAGADGAAAPS